MATFLLLHGAWHGSWCWDLVSARLDDAGHHVVAPDLPGLSPATTHAAGRFGLGNHIGAVSDALDHTAQRNVILVAHSYAGMLARAIEGIRPDRLAHVCYIEALLPEPGQAALDLLPENARAALIAGHRERPDGPVLLPPDVSRFAVPDARLAKMIAGRLLPQPFRTLTDPLPPAPARGVSPVARTYVFANDRTPNPYQAVIDRIRADPSWSIVSLSGGHELMLVSPNEIADLLLAIAGTAGREQPRSCSNPKEK